MELPKKQSMASLIGATSIESENEFGRIHVCFYSNPGMGKSGILEPINQVFSNTHSADNNSSGVGLTGTVTQTEDNRWRVTAGTMVFADKGVLTIDEFDKVGDEDLGSLNTAMESGYIKINKAARAKLPARASIIVGGNFQKTLTRYDRVQDHLPEKAVGLSDRFALMSAVTDQDSEEVSDAILNKHSEAEESGQSVVFDEEELVVYRGLARSFNPRLSDEAISRLKHFIQAEKDVAESKDNTEFQGTSNRFIENLSKLTMMFARARFSSTTTAEDAEDAYELFRECRESLGAEVGDPDIKGMQRKRFSEIKETYDLLEEDSDENLVEKQELFEESSLEENQAEKVLDRLKRDGEFYEPEPGRVAKV